MEGRATATRRAVSSQQQQQQQHQAKMGAEAEPRWYGELAAANSAVSGTQFDEVTIRRRAGLLRDVKRRSGDADAWVVYLKFLNTERRREMKALPARSPRRAAMHRALLRLYQVAVRVVPLSAANRHSVVYLRLWLDFAVLMAEDGEARGEAREIFKLIKLQRIGHFIPSFYETWAEFEEHCNNHAKAAKLREDAAKCRRVHPPARPAAANTTAEKVERKSSCVSNSSLAGRYGGGEGVERKVDGADKVQREVAGQQKKYNFGQPLAPLRCGSGQQYAMLKTGVSTVKGTVNNADGKENVEPRAMSSLKEMREIKRSEVVNMVVENGKKVSSAEPVECANRYAKYEAQATSKSNTRSVPTTSTLSKDPTSSSESDQDGGAVGRKVSRSADSSGEMSCATSSGDKSRADKRTVRSPTAEMASSQERKAVQRRYAATTTKRSRFERLMSSENRVFVNGRPYQVLGRVGKGGSSQVYKVLSEDLEVLALKRVQVSPENTGALESYANEIELLQRLVGRDTIVQMRDAEVQQKNGLIHVVMECGDIDLAKLLSRSKGKKMHFDVIRTYWRQMLEAVDTIHENRIVHGDLKPANFISVSGTLKLIDFGIAKAIVAEDTTKILRDSPVGTPNYMSPEALKALDDEDEAGYMDDSMRRRYRYRVGRGSDIWSLGCILYQMVYGKTPFAHIRDTYRKAARIKDPSHEISFRGIDNVQLLDVLRGCLERDPEKRLTIPQLQSHPFLRNDGGENESVGTKAILNAMQLKGFSIYDSSGTLANTGCVQDAIRPLLQPQQITSKDDSGGGRGGYISRMPSTPSVSAITKSDKSAAYAN